MTRYDEVLQGLLAAPRTWVVTGAAGFIGSHLTECLLRLDQRVTALDNFSTGTRANLAQVREAVSARQWRNFRLIEGDIRSLDTCRRACQSAAVILHQAALGSVPLSIEDPVNCNASNVDGFVNILTAARETGVSRLVYAGSSATYGDDPAMPKVEGQIGRPLSPYGLSKYVNELYAETFARCYNFGSIGLRYFNVFGPRQDPNGAYAAVIPKWIGSMIHNDAVFIYGDGETVRDFCYIDNVVQANLLAATVEDPAAVNQVYNIAVGEATSLNQLFETIRTLLSRRFLHVRDLRPVYRDFRSGDVRLSLADISKAQSLLGYQPTWRIGDGLEQSIEWYVGMLEPGALPETQAREAFVGTRTTQIDRARP